MNCSGNPEQGSLFERPKPSLSGRVISVAVARPFGTQSAVYTYQVPSALTDLGFATPVLVPFGNGFSRGFVAGPSELYADVQNKTPSLSLERIKPIESKEELAYVPSKAVAELCKWASQYYAIPLGELLNAAFPQIQTPPKRIRSRAAKKDSSSKPVELTTTQQEVVTRILGRMKASPFSVSVLHGVTGSGKTEVYCEAIRAVLDQGGGALVLAPEIALTPQLQARFETRLQTEVGVWHSALPEGRKKDLYLRMTRGELKVMVGARSAIFCPIQNLSLIVVDEEHDPSYKQEEGRVRYQARDLAIVRAKNENAHVILGSATPCIESLERVHEGKYHLESLPERATTGGLPTVELINLKDEPKIDGIQAVLAAKTLELVRETLNAGEQVIVYLNRRGFASFILCKDCGTVCGCPNCSITLTFHKNPPRLKCHICAHTEALPDFCTKCQGSELIPIGAGTESLESQLPALLPQAKILRLDRDLITSTSRLEKTLALFRSGEANLLLGTQMLVKGHDFPGVTLVVVVLADALFRFPDYRAPERALQVLKQVSGRSGRGDRPGKVLIQTYDPDFPVLQVLDGRLSEAEFLSQERELRQALSYPPFGRLTRIRIERDKKEVAVLHARQIADAIQSQSIEGIDLLGPSEAFIERVKGTYRWDIVIKARSIASLQSVLSVVRRFCEAEKHHAVVDVDPML